MAKKTHHIKIIGRREFVDFPLLQLNNMEAKVDTGAYTSSLHCENISIKIENEKPVLYFSLVEDQMIPHRFEDFYTKRIKNSFGEMEERFVVKTTIHIGKKNIRLSISLSNRDSMRYPVLIGRRLLKGKFLIDVNQIHTGGIALRQLNQLYH